MGQDRRGGAGQQAPEGLGPGSGQSQPFGELAIGRLDPIAQDSDRPPHGRRQSSPLGPSRGQDDTRPLGFLGGGPGPTGEAPIEEQAPRMVSTCCQASSGRCRTTCWRRCSM
jgi:hypothetical protein